jgi:hypothetical protein
MAGRAAQAGVNRLSRFSRSAAISGETDFPVELGRV